MGGLNPFAEVVAHLDAEVAAAVKRGAEGGEGAVGAAGGVEGAGLEGAGGSDGGGSVNAAFIPGMGYVGSFYAHDLGSSSSTGRGSSKSNNK